MHRIITVIMTGLLALSALAKDAPKDLQLFLLIGQSNMAGRGAVEPEDKKPIPKVFMLTKALEWVPAVDPIHFDRPQIVGVGMGRTFARTLLKSDPHASIGLIPAAVGGSSLDQWKVGGEMYTDAVKRAKAAMKSGKLRGILWHQGESDSVSEEKIATYRERFRVFLTALREELGAGDTPLVAGALGDFRNEKAPLTPKMNEQLALLPLTVKRVAFVPSEGLVHKGDGTHFDSPSLREFGRRYAQAFLMLDGTWGSKAK